MVAADGVNSGSAIATPRTSSRTIDWRPNRFVWLGTTCRSPRSRSSSRRAPHGLFRVHAYRYEEHWLDVHRRVPRGDVARRGPRRRRRGRDGRVLREAVRRRARRATGCSRTARSGAASRPCATSAGTTGTSCWSATPRTPRTSRSARAPSSRWRTRSRCARRSASARDVPDGARRLRGRAPAAGRDASSARRRRASSGSRTPSATWTLEPLQFAFNLMTRSLRITHENLQGARPRVRGRRSTAGSPIDAARAERRRASPRPSAAAADVHAVPAARAACCANRVVGLADVPVLGGRRHARRLAPRPPRQPRRSAAPAS